MRLIASLPTTRYDRVIVLVFRYLNIAKCNTSVPSVVGLFSVRKGLEVYIFPILS